MAKQSSDECPEERESARIRAFLARVRPLIGNEVRECYWDGRALIEALALAFETEDESYHWSVADCATVADFISAVQPVKGTCFCNDDSRVNATCGFHEVLYFMQSELLRAAKAKGRKRAA
jgi:hypothetical protein